LLDDFLDAKGFLFTLIKYVLLYAYIRIATNNYEKIIKTNLKYITLGTLAIIYVSLKVFFIK